MAVTETVVVATPGMSDAPASAVSWGAIIAGGLVAAATSFLLISLGAGLGLSTVSPWNLTASSLAALGVGTIIWLIVTQWIASGLGGYVAGRMRTRWTGIHNDEVFFRDTAHGLLAWCLALIVSVGLLASTVSAIVSGVGSAATAVTSSAVSGAAEGAADGAMGGTPMTYFTDMLYRAPAPAGTAAAGTTATDTAAAPAAATTATDTAAATTTTAADGTTTAPAAGTTVAQVQAPPATTAPAAMAPAASPEESAANRAEGSRIFVNGVVNGELPAEDKTYLAQIIADETGLTPAEAEARIDSVTQQVEAAKAKATEAADAARKVAASLALFGFAALLIGAFIAAVAAAYGGHLRDEIDASYRPAVM